MFRNCFKRFNTNICWTLLVVFFILTTILNAVLLLNHIKLCNTELLNADDQQLTMNLPETQKIIDDLYYRLPTSILPEKYELFLNPNLTSGVFTGNVKILLNVTENTPKIILHAYHDVNVVEVNVKRSDRKEEIKVLSVEKTNDKREFLIIQVENELQRGFKYNLTISFNGVSKDKIVGFYSSQYTDPNGKKRKLVTSKFEPTHARQAFPCFDEPKMKANYSVKLVKPKENNYIALNNMNEIKTESYSDTESVVTFEESVAMSTYLACFMVCDFDYLETVIEPNLGDPIKLRVYARPAQNNKMLFALDVASKILPYYVDFFQIAYPLPKLDLAAIPDFPSGALETWGLVTFRETSLLYNDKKSSIVNKERVATVIAHELAHMWFGNLVTMDWWDELWLNEGFAAFLQFIGTAHVFKDWQMENNFLIEKLHSAFKIDAKLSSHPIIVKVLTPEEINAVFDIISYNKGSSLLRMLQNFVGEDNFRNGVTYYLNKNKYRTAKSENLFEAVQKFVDPIINIADIMDTWVNQMGFPEVIVETVSPGVYKLTQQRFLSSPLDATGSQEAESKYRYKWTIPITYITNKIPNSPVLKFFEYDLDALIIREEMDIDWIKFNVDQTGFFRVNYEESMWKKLMENYKNFSIADRTSLLNDAFNLANAERLSFNMAFDFTQKLIDETEHVPWTVAAEFLNDIKKLIYNQPTYFKLRSYVMKIIKNALNVVNWKVNESDTYLQRNLRIVILRLACNFQVPECLETAGILFKKFCTDPSETPHQDIRSIVLKFGMQTVGTEEEWNILWNRYLNENDAQEQAAYREGLSSIRNPIILSKYIDLAWNTDNVRRQDYFNCLISISNNVAGTPIVWDYVRSSWPMFIKRFGLNDRSLGTMIPAITKTFSSDIKLKEVKDFFMQYPDAGAGEAQRKIAIEGIETNIKWLANNLKHLSEWLDEHANLI